MPTKSEAIVGQVLGARRVGTGRSQEVRFESQPVCEILWVGRVYLVSSF